MIKRLTKISYTLIFLLYASASFAIPGVSGEETQSITKTSARLLATINGDGSARTVVFELSTDPNMTTFTSIFSQSSTTGFSQRAVDVTSLSIGTTYYWRVYVYGGGAAVRSQIISFNTLPNDLAPIISNVSSTSVTTTGANILYQVANGPFTSKIWYGTTSGALTSSINATSGTAPLSTNATITGLANGTRYYYQVEVTNNVSTERSAELSFFTLTPNLVASFKFDNNKTSIDGAITFGAGANTFVNDRNLVSNKALQFANDRVNIAIPGLPTAATNRTISIWAKLDSALPNSYSYIYGYGAGMNGTAYNLAIFKDAMSNHSILIDLFGVNVTGTTPNPFDVSVWHNYVTSYDGTTAKIYVDGVLIGSTTVGINTNGNNFYVGGSSYGGSSFTGAVDDLLIYNRVFTATEISDLYTSTLSTLPVTLVSYTAKSQNNNAVLNWKTSSENNNSHFVVAKSTDGVNFSQLATVNAKSTQGAEYVYTDYNTISETNYYRLTQVDLDGKTTNLGVKAVKMSITEANVQIYPNPATDFVNLSFEAGNYSTAVLVDINGKVLNTVSIAKVQNTVAMDLSNVNPGNYFVQLIGTNSKTVKKVIKR
ncbi:LamG-like jellyroll fold domain-containing protein [Pedobacter alpinus]|uniref:LamG-like jellyroll fold domain-containing protein n=1 Tax=Pedobacter alpinus TaxID=1590643 RepID=A0ABW5TN45_9SPHI